MRIPSRAIGALLLVLAAGCRAPADEPSDGGLRSDGGTTLPEGGEPTVGWNETVEVGAQRDAQVVDIQRLDVDLNSAGDGFVVWGEATDRTGSVWINRLQDGRWADALRLSEEAVIARFPAAAQNDAGEAIVAWVVTTTDENGFVLSSAVWARRWSGTAWSEPERVSDVPDGSGVDGPSVGIDDSGRAFVAWNQSGDARGIQANVHDGSAWSGPQGIEDTTLLVAEPTLGVAANGTAIVVWRQNTKPYDPGQSGGGPSIANIWARRWADDAWGEPQRIGSELVDFEFAERARLDVAPDGEAFVVWEEHRLEEARIVAARFDPETTAWDDPVPLAIGAARTDHLAFASVAADGHGNAFATWWSAPSEGDDEHGAAASFDGASGTWSTPSTFVSNWSVDETRAAMGAAGEAWAICTRPTDEGRELSARARTGDAWADPVSLGRGEVRDAQGNAKGAVLVGSVHRFYANSRPLMRVVPVATLYLPRTP